MSSFFTRPTSTGKRKRSDIGAFTTKKLRTEESPRSRKLARDVSEESISGSESELSDESGAETGEDLSGASSDQGETAAERRLRLAEQYLANVRDEVGQEVGFDAEQVDRELIANRLKEDAAEMKGRLYRHIASSFAWESASRSFFRQGDAGTTTAVAACSPYLYVATKDLRIMKWKIPDLLATNVKASPDYALSKKCLSRSQQRKLRAKNARAHHSLPADQNHGRPELVLSTRGSSSNFTDQSYQHHTRPILAVAASADGNFLASGGADRKLIIWDTRTLRPIRVFSQHRAAVTSLAFRRGSNQLFSGSADRTVKVWSLDELAYIETLFGHQDEVLDVAALAMERCVSVGGRDRTARVWKVVEETQLVFRGGGVAHDRVKGKEVVLNGPVKGEHTATSAYGEGSIDRVALIDDEMFVTGADNGSISLWSVQKKKPLHVVPLAHGIDPQLEPEEAFAEEAAGTRETPGPPLPRWITALAAVPYSDIVVSGSWDGSVRVWKISQDKRRLEQVGAVGTGGKADGQQQIISRMLSRHANGEKPGAGVQLEDSEDETERLALINRHADEAKRRTGIRGIINDIEVFERGHHGKEVIYIVVGVGREPRLGRWRKFKGRPGTIMYEVSRAPLTAGKSEVEAL